MRKKMRSLLEEKEYLVTPGVANPMQAMVVEKVGFDYVYMTGYGTSLTILGLTDVGLITETEMVTNAKNIARAVNIPVISDADTGFGNAINVIKTVEDYEAAGVAGIHMEDQVSPKRCGHLAGKNIIPLEEAVGKIKAATDAKNDKDFIIIQIATQISKPHVDALNSLPEEKKILFFVELRKSLLLRNLMYNIDIKNNRYMITDQIFIEDNKISKNDLFKSIKNVFNICLYSNILLSEICSGKLDKSFLEREKETASGPSFSLYS